MGQIYVADGGNHRVMCWSQGAKEGTNAVGANEYGQQSNQFSYPKGYPLIEREIFCVVDCRNHRIQKFEIE